MPELHDRLRDIAALDILANNTDRKSGHCLLVPERDGARRPTVWGIDHGLCFAAEYKLRTVIWEFGDEPFPDHVLAAANRLVDARAARHRRAARRRRGRGDPGPRRVDA